MKQEESQYAQRKKCTEKVRTPREKQLMVPVYIPLGGDAMRGFGMVSSIWRPSLNTVHSEDLRIQLLVD